MSLACILETLNVSMCAYISTYTKTKINRIVKQTVGLSKTVCFSDESDQWANSVKIDAGTVSSLVSYKLQCTVQVGENSSSMEPQACVKSLEFLEDSGIHTDQFVSDRYLMGNNRCQTIATKLTLPPGPQQCEKLSRKSSLTSSTRFL